MRINIVVEVVRCECGQSNLPDAVYCERCGLALPVPADEGEKK